MPIGLLWAEGWERRKGKAEGGGEAGEEVTLRSVWGTEARGPAGSGTPEGGERGLESWTAAPSSQTAANKYETTLSK